MVSCVTMIQLVQLLFIYFIQNTICAAIEIKIDADDALKILKALIMSPSFNGLLGGARKSTLSSFNNPYHPEDDILSKNEVMVKSQASVAQSAEDTRLENENKNFNGKVSEDELADTFDDPSISNATIPDDELRQKNNATVDSVDAKNAIEDINDMDSKDFKPLQRRFAVLKGGM